MCKQPACGHGSEPVEGLGSHECPPETQQSPGVTWSLRRRCCQLFKQVVTLAGKGCGCRGPDPVPPDRCLSLPLPAAGVFDFRKVLRSHIGMPLYNSSQLGSNFNDVITEYNYEH